jgi:hypothetical protein
LGFEKIDACALRAEVRFEADEDERGCGAEVKDFRVPLVEPVRGIPFY